jgi:hypothetical protein
MRKFENAFFVNVILSSCLSADTVSKDGFKLKQLGCIILSFLILSCNSEEGSDCFKKQGEETTKIVEVETFSQISVSEGIELIVKESDEQKVKITAGKNLINDIQFEVVDGILKIEDQNSCGMFRNISIAKVLVETPNLEKIYSATQFTVRSDGILHFPELTLETGIDEETASSLFEMQIENETLNINDNVSSVFKISGSTENLNVNFWGANGRLEAENLNANHVDVFHRSTNDMIVKPLETVTGTLYSTGNLVLKNVPPVIEVEELYSGHVVYP